MERLYKGYHGTKKTDGDAIIKDQCFKHSNGEDEWLGFGCYFFKDNPCYAEWWAKDVKKFDSYKILETEISVNPEKIFDLSTTEALQKLEKCANMLMQRRKKSKSFASKKINDNLVINYIYNNIEKFDMVMGIFPHQEYKYSSDFKFLSLYRSRLRPYQIQMCVRNRVCIKKNISEYKSVD